MDENKIAVVAIISHDFDSSEKINALLHDFGGFIVSRMGIPYRDKGVNVISVVLDAPAPVINGLTGKLGMIKGVSAKALYSGK